jgi:predicted phosphodiesterase
MGVINYAILNDIHFPYESPLYYKALSQIESYGNLQGIILNGDIAEIESASSHPKGPNARNRLIEEIAYLNEKLDEIQKRFPDVPIAYICGNHEHRIFRFLRDQASILFGYLDMPVLLKLTERKNFRFFEYSTDQLVRVGKCRDLYARHEPLAGGAVHTKGTAEKAVVSIIYGHTHVYQSYTHKKFGPSPYSVTAISNGFLGEITSPIFEYRGCKDNWQEGHMKINCDENSGEYECHFQALYRQTVNKLISL